MADGSTKPIVDVAPGDAVAAADPKTGVAGPRQVTQLHVNVDRDLTDVTVRDRGTGKTTVLKTTQNHPFWDATDGRWVDAGRLIAGHQLLAHDDKRLEGDGTGAGTGGGGPPVEVTVVKVANHAGNEVMRDLTVADLHTYYVVAGDTPVLVHNNDGCKKTAVFGVQEHSNKLADNLRGANPGKTYETYNDPMLARVAPGEFRPAWMNRVSDAVHDSDGYDIAISLDGLGRYGSNPTEIFQNAVKEGGRLDGRGLPLNCATCWELRQVARVVAGGSRSAGSVSFFSGGAKLDDFNPFD